MGKKCIICGRKAEFKIKGANEYYCEECAEENFGELELLQKIEEEARLLKKLVEERAGKKDDEDREN